MGSGGGFDRTARTAEPILTQWSRLMSYSPIFIVGAARSGTTLLRSLLSAHSRVVVTPESYFLSHAASFGGLDEADPGRCEAFWQSYTARERFSRFEVDSARCRELAAASRAYQGIAALLYGTLEAYRERYGTPRVGEKTPDHVRFVPSILATFANARVIVMQRDPRAVVASQLLRMSRSAERDPGVKKKRGQNIWLRRVAGRALNWNWIYARAVPAVRHDGRVLVVRYEDLVINTHALLQKICDFIDEPFEETMLTNRSNETVPAWAVFENLDPVEREWGKRHHERSLKPIDKDMVEAWMSELGSDEVALIEGICAGAMHEAGYACASTPLHRHVLGASGVVLRHTARVERRLRRVLNLQ